MVTIIVFFIVLSVLIIIHELGHFIAAKRSGVYVEEFGFGLPPRIFGIKHGETLYSLNWLPFGGFVKVMGEEQHELVNKKLSLELKSRTFYSKKPLTKIIILTAGVLANFLLGWLIVSYLFTQGVPIPTDKVVIEQVSKKSPAEVAGIKKGDTVVALVEKGRRIPFENTDHFVKEVKNRVGQEITLIINRQGQEFNLNMIPRLKPPMGEGALGVLLSPFVIKKYPWYQAPFLGLFESMKITGLILKELLKTVLGLLLLQKPQVEVAGPIGIAKITSEAVKYGYTAVLQLLGLLSLNLAVINILPFPALDGGRLAFVIYETVSKRQINPDLERKLNLVGFIILLSLILLVTANDVAKIFLK